MDACKFSHIERNMLLNTLHCVEEQLISQNFKIISTIAKQLYSRSKFWKIQTLDAESKNWHKTSSKWYTHSTISTLSSTFCYKYTGNSWWNFCHASHEMAVKPWTISNDSRFQFLVGNCSPLMMFCTMYDTKSTFSDCLYTGQITELYLSL